MRKKTLSLLLLVTAMLLALPSQAQDFAKKAAHNKASKNLQVSLPTLKNSNVDSKRNASVQLESRKNRLSHELNVKSTPNPKRIAAATGEEVDENGIIITPGVGESKIYQRSGYTYNSGWKNQYGPIEIVECSDGTIYIKDILFPLSFDTWVKGTKNGNTITIPSGQVVYYISSYDYGLYVSAVEVDDEGYVNPIDDDITFTIDGNVISQDPDDVMYGCFWTDDNSWYSYLNTETVWTYYEEDPENVTITPPANLTTETWYIQGTTVSSSGSGNLDATVTLGFDGNNVYIQGIFSDFPNAWIKGTIEGSTVTFKDFQYQGIYNTTNNIYAIGYDVANGALTDFTMTYDATNQVFTNVNYLAANADLYQLVYLDLYDDFVIQKEKPVEILIDELPYLNEFETADEMKLFKVIDANDDGSTWTMSGGIAQYKWNGSNTADDWLMSVGIKLEAGKKYHFAIDTWAQSTNYPERIEILMGKTNDPGDLGTEVIPATDVTWASPQTLEKRGFTVSKTGYYYFGVHAISDADQYYLNADNFFIEEEKANDLAIAVSAPSTVKAGSSANITAIVQNKGNNAASGYTVTIKAGDKELLNETVSEELASLEMKEFTAELATTVCDEAIAIVAEVTYASDEDTRNNTAETQITILQSTVPSPENLVAEDKGSEGVDLSWEAPISESGKMTEDFEDTSVFPAFSLGGITATEHNGIFGEWKLYDSTGAEVWGFSDTEFDNMGAPHAWQVLDPEEAGLGTGYYPPSGSQCLLSVCPLTSEGVPADHWLISPLLTGEAQTISFQLRAITSQYGEESFEVLASSTDTDPASFSTVQSFDTDVVEWTEFTADLPAGTKYFAIRHTSDDIFGILIDDITYEKGALTPTAYNIYYDGELIGTVDGDATTYTVGSDEISTGEHTFGVSAVYEEGDESKPATATVTIGGSFLPGDVNHDGQVNITDVTLTVNFILSGATNNFYWDEANLNGDTDVNITDVTAMVNLILTQQNSNN